MTQTPDGVLSSRQTSIRLSAANNLDLVLGEPLSSATAKKGQTVRMKLDGDWFAEGHFIAPSGTAVAATVRRVEHAMPGKRNGRVIITSGSIQLPSGKSVPLNIQMPDGCECDDPGPCILVGSIFAVVEAPLLAIELPVLLVELPKVIKKERAEGQAMDVQSEESSLPLGGRIRAWNRRPFHIISVLASH
jgi:hypothetical protein